MSERKHVAYKVVRVSKDDGGRERKTSLMAVRPEMVVEYAVGERAYARVYGDVKSLLMVFKSKNEAHFFARRCSIQNSLVRAEVWKVNCGPELVKIYRVLGMSSVDKFSLGRPKPMRALVKMWGGIAKGLSMMNSRVIAGHKTIVAPVGTMGAQWVELVEKVTEAE
jgi:hypothetical protein